MTQASTTTPGKGKAFFDRADQVAETGNWDFAIEMYLEGIQREPDNVERGHKPLRNVALQRKLKGGKPAGGMDKIKRRQGKDNLQNLLNAEYLLAKDPGDVANMELVLKAAAALELPATLKWITDSLLETQKQGKPQLRILRMLVQSYEHIQDYRSAVLTVEMAVELAPNDDEINQWRADLSAKYTLQKGKFGEEGDFTKGVKDFDEQRKLMEQDKVAQSSDYLQQVIAKARGEYEAAPTVAGKINAYVDALIKVEDESYENEAIDVLAKAHKDIGAYAFKMRIGEIRMRQLKRRFQKLHAAGDKAAAKAAGEEVVRFEIEEFTERVANYPTDLNFKYELGARLLHVARYDDAIPLLQQAQRDPRRHVQAMIRLGQAWARKGALGEAAETFTKALEAEMGEERTKEVRYNLGLIYEQMDNLPKAQEQFSQVAMLDYNYKDARTRLDEIRKKLSK